VYRSRFARMNRYTITGVSLREDGTGRRPVAFFRISSEAELHAAVLSAFTSFRPEQFLVPAPSVSEKRRQSGPR
jgi:hypothetical protein